MSLTHAVLGFLRSGPMTGYDLKKQFDATVHHFWPADRAQIYRTLARLAELGFTEAESVPQAGKPDQKVHRITKAGREELKRWLTTPQTPPEVREATLVQIFFASAVSDGQAKTILSAQREALQHHADALRDLAASRASRSAKSPGETRERFFRRLTLEHGVAMLEAELAWLEAAAAQLEAGASQGWTE